MLLLLCRIVPFSLKWAKLRFKPRTGKKFRKMAKNAPKKGRSVRNGNTPSPYTKYDKRPYKYNFPGAYAKVGGGGGENKYADRANKGY